MGGQFEVKDGATKKYYSLAGMMVAVNDGTGLQYLLTDHLGSTVAVTNQSGTLTSQQRYLPFGAERTIPNSPILGTDFTYTGQRKLDDGMGGIMDYKARFYSPYLNHFSQPDTLVSDPYNPQAWNRYAYVLNNPIRYNDPTGHIPSCGSGRRCSRPIGDKRDLTTWLVAAAVDIAESAEMQSIKSTNTTLAPSYMGINKAKAYATFEFYVKDGAKYDVKYKMLELFKGDPIKIGNNWYEYSTAGNILYGFYGKAAGFSEFELRAGAGKAQRDDYNEDPERGIGPCGYPYFCDTEDDYAAVGFGMYLYDNYYEKDNELTQADLLDAFENYEYSNDMALRDKPKVFQPRYFEYPVDRFYQHME